ncbi:MAG: N-acetylmuramoyl-L-alanine amidase [Nannocystaceae bacterium]
MPIPAPQMAKGPDYGSSVWHPSPNYSSRPSGSAGTPTFVIIHSCEGGYSGCWGWLANKASGVSAHYVVKENGGEISQLVKEANKAWHIAATYKCSLNGNVECGRNGASSNNFTIGIEHAGYASQKSWQSGLIEASAKLVCNISKDRGIKRDKYHIVAHGKLQPYNRVDPGANWPWSSYISKVNGYCGQNPQPQPNPQPNPQPDPDPTTIVIDSNNANNNQNVAKIAVSGNWTSSASTAGYYGSGYWFAGTKAVSDGAEFSFYLPSAQTRTVDAWWTQGGNRAAAAPYVIFDAQGNKLGTVKVSQQKNGSKWVKLGEWKFTKGWNKVVLSRWTAEGSVVIGDAVRIR